MSMFLTSRPSNRGSVVGLSLGKFAWVGSGVGVLITSAALAAPAGEKVVKGSAQFQRDGNLTKITAADKTVINYDSFNIGKHEGVQFIQPSATSKVLNRITGSDPSKIEGSLSANGIVYIVNPAGVFFANGALVNVGGLYAAAGNLSNNDFDKGVNNFTNLSGSVVNQGHIKVLDGGVAALVGQNVINAGQITADNGVVAMVAGSNVVLADRGGVMSVHVNKDAPAPNPSGAPAVLNSGKINARGRHGATRIVAGDMFSLAVKNTGTINSSDIKINAQGQSSAVVSGSLNARNNSGKGGSIEITGDKVFLDHAQIDASGKSGGGQINIGGDFQGKGDRQSSKITVVQNSQIKADAVTRGDGGQVVVWSDNHTSFHNSKISARGGALSGNGGLVETSGKQTLDVRGGRVDASAPHGSRGAWLLDPNDVTIDQVASTTGGTFSGGNPDTFTPSATAVVDVDDINAALNGGTSVEIITGSTGSDNGNITLVAGVTIDKTAGAAADLTLRAANNINIDGTIQSSSDTLNVNLLANNGSGGNTDPNPSSGSVNLGAASVINTNGGNLVIEGTDFTGTAGFAVNAGAGDVFFRRSNSGTVGLGLATGDMQVDNAELAQITADDLIVGGLNTTNIRVNGVTGTAVANLTTVTLNATDNGASINFAAGNSTFKDLVAQADDGIAVDANITVTTGDLILNGDFDNTADTNDTIDFAAGITLSTLPSGGNIVLDAATGGIDAAGALTLNAAQNITLAADITAAASLNLSAGGSAMLEGVQANSTLVVNANSGISLLSNVSSAGAAIFNADADADGSGTWTLASGQTINTGNNNLTITAADVDLAGSIASGTGTLSLRRANAGTIGLGASAGDMQIDAGEISRITVATLAVGDGLTTSIAVDSVSATDTANISALISLTTDDINIAGPLDTANADLSITRATIGTIGLGTATGGLSIDGTELSNITTNELLIGDGQTTSITVSGVTAGQSAGIETLRLDAADSITFNSGASTFRGLSAIADDGIVINSDLTTTDSGMTLEGNADNDADVNDNIAIADMRMLTSAGTLTLDATTGGIDAAGSVSLRAKGDITINDTLSANGEISIRADSDANFSGTITVPAGVTILSSGNLIALAGNNLVLNGNINAGAGSVTVERTAPGRITLGTGTQGFVISAAELSRIISTGMTIGGSQTRFIDVNSISAANSNNIVGILRLQALADDGRIEFNGSTSTFNALEAFADDVVRFNSDVTTDIGGMTLNGDFDNAADTNDSVYLRANISVPASQDMTFQSDVTLGKDTTLAAKNVTFQKRVDSAVNKHTLTVNTSNSGITTFAGSVGSVNPLKGLLTNADGTTRLGGDIRTDKGGIIFNDAVRLTADVKVRASGGFNIEFNNTIDSLNSTPRDLTVLTDVTDPTNPNVVPYISFARDVGSTFALGDLNLNYDPSQTIDGHISVPRVATIFARPRNPSNNAILTGTEGTFNFTMTGAFNMGRNEKFTTAGNLNITAASARLGDLTTTRNMKVTAPSIALLSRNPALLLGFLGGLAMDSGTDYVAGGTINFSVVPTVLGSGPAPSFSTPSAAGDVSNTLSGFVFRAFGNLTISDINRVSNSTVVTLDLRAEGPTNTNPADAIAGAIPRESRQNDVGQQTSIGQAEMEDLKNLGIVPRNATSQELLDFLVGRAVYNDVPRRTAPGPDDYTTVVNRLPVDRVSALLNAYNRLFNTDLLDDEGNPVIDQATGKVKRVSRADEIKETLLGSVRRYRAANPSETADINPLNFRAFIDTTPEESQTAQYLKELAIFLDELEEVGLTPRELTTSKNILLKDVRPAGIGSISNFERVIRANVNSISLRD